MKPEQQDEYIVQALRMQGAMYEDDARQFLAEHDDRVRAAALAEAGEAVAEIASQMRDKRGWPDRFAAPDAVAAVRAAAQEMQWLATVPTGAGEEATPTGATATPDFFVAGRTYTVRGFTYQCRTVETHPGKGEREAWGWLHRGGVIWRLERLYDADYTADVAHSGEASRG